MSALGLPDPGGDDDSFGLPISVLLRVDALLGGGGGGDEPDC
jgi:hypothetical protein